MQTHEARACCQPTGVKEVTVQRFPKFPCRWMACLLLAASPVLSWAEETASKPFKLSVGRYSYSDGTHAQDTNLRWQDETTHAWFGYYSDPNSGYQSRVGIDKTIDLGGSISVQPSFQAATGGFAGGSVNLQFGHPWFGLLGWGRTNLRPYFNLNFDPNDAVTLGVGWVGERQQSVLLSVVADDRLHTGQKDWHLLTRMPLGVDVRLTLDVLHKTGLGDAGLVNGWGLSTTLDFPDWSIRLARDPMQNFSVINATRVTVAFRF